MERYLYVFGYESPEEQKSNALQGTDFESSRAAFIQADSSDAALTWGQRLAGTFVHGLFNGDEASWASDAFANWIETSPNATWDLGTIPEIKAGDQKGLHALVKLWTDDEK